MSVTTPPVGVTATTASAVTPGAPAFDAERVRALFPLLQRTVHGKSLVYLDSGASSPMPLPVIAAVDSYERNTHSNVHRGVHRLSQEATEAYEGAREHVRRFVNARSVREVVFTRGTTEAINLVAQSWGRSQLHAGDEVLITHLEHHANIVPWQLACRATGARLVAAPLSANGEVDLQRFEALIGPRTRLIAVAHVSNALGTVLPLTRIGALAQARGIPWLVDGAQAIAHERIDVQALGCDFYAFSGHKMYGHAAVQGTPQLSAPPHDHSQRWILQHPGHGTDSDSTGKHCPRQCTQHVIHIFLCLCYIWYLVFWSFVSDRYPPLSRAGRRMNASRTHRDAAHSRWFVRSPPRRKLSGVHPCR